MKSKSFDIVICPSRPIARQAISVSRTLEKHGGLFVLDCKNYFPHITLYMAEFPIKNLPKVRKVLRDFASKIKRLDYSFKANKIGLFRLGEHGVCRKLIEIFSLS